MNLVTKTVSILSALFSVSLLAAGIHLKDNLAFKAVPGQLYSLDLLTTLETPDISGDGIVWSVANQPAWLKLDSPNHRLYGLPSLSDSGSSFFRLVAVQGESADIATVRFDVVGNPIWIASQLDFGIVAANHPFEVDLHHYLQSVSGDSIRFHAESLPEWLTLDPFSGKLVGAPGKLDAGKFGPIELTATGNAGTSTTTAQGEVVAFDAGVIHFKQDAFNYKVEEKTLVSVYLNQLVTSDASTCRWGIGGEHPVWISLNQKEGLLGGTAPPVTVDTKFLFKLFFVCPDHTGDATTVSITVVPSETPNVPVFTVKELTTVRFTLPVPPGRQMRSEYVFSLLTLEDWVTLYQNGELELRPEHPHIGTHSFLYRVVDSNGKSITGRFSVVVVKNPQPPVWLYDPIKLSATAEHAFASDLCSNVANPNGVFLQLALLSGPSWAKVGGCAITGTPTSANVGTNSFVIRAQTEGGTADVTVNVVVQHVNHPPAFVQNPIVLPDAYSGFSYSADLSAFVTNPDGELLNFTKLTGSNWIALMSSGTLFGSPRPADIGIHKIQVRVATGQGLFAEAVVVIRVLQTNQPVQWISSPIQLPVATHNTVYCVSLKQYVVNLTDHDLRVFFSKVAGPDWLSVGSDGRACGTPRLTGENTFIFSVKSDGNAAQTEGIVRVE